MEADEQPPKPTFSPTTPPENDPVETESSGGAGIIISIVVALIGVVFGAIGIFFGLSSQKKITALETSIAEIHETQASLPEQISSATAGIGEVEKTLSSLSNSVDALKSRSRMDRDSVARNFDKYAKAIEANRTQINDNTDAISDIPKMAVPAAVAPRTTVVADSGDSDAAIETVVPEGEAGVHLIESGDTFGRLSAKYGVSVQAIVNANPGLDPRRLQVGQPVTIPAPVSE